MQVTSNEKFLLYVLAAIIFVGGNYFGYRWLAQKQTSLQLAYAQARADQADAKVDLLESDQWTQRKQWVSAHLPAAGDEGEAHAAVLAYVKKGADDNKLNVLEQSLNGVEHAPTATRMDVSMKVKGSMQDLVKWMTAIEQPDQFYAITSFSLNADEDKKSMVCTVQISRYFKAGS